MYLGFCLYFVFNISVLYFYYRKYNGIYEAPFLIAYTSIFVMLPQLAAIYSFDYYRTSTFTLFIYTIIGCNVAFVVGFEFVRCKKHKTNYESILVYSKVKVLLFVCTLLGFYSIFTWASVYQGSDNVIQSKLLSFGAKSLCLVAPFLIRKKSTIEMKIIALLSIIPLAYFAFGVKGSRGSTLFLVLILSFIFSQKYSRSAGKIKKITVAILVFGAVASASIGLIRHILVGNPADGERSSVSDLSLMDTYLNSFSIKETGFDLGNAVYGIDYLYKTNQLDYGVTYLWDDFIQNNIPRRWVGENFKDGLKFNLVDDDRMIESITRSITTMTGYYYAYRSFGIFSPLLFFLVGYLLGFIWYKSKYSMFALFLYLSILSNVPLLLTHSPGYIYGGVEFVFIFMYPFMFNGIKRIKIQNKNGK